MNSSAYRRRSRVAAMAVLTCSAALTLAPESALSHNPTTTTVLFEREIAAVLQNKCWHCHQEGRMAMSLATYAEARPWAVAIKEEILARRMPPWSAERGYGQFANDAGLTMREQEFLVSWVDGGAPKGAGDAPPFVEHSGHWMLGQPDALASAVAGATVPANHAVHVARIVVDTGLNRERWLRALDYRPGDLRVVRAAFFSVAATGEYLGGWTPSGAGTTLPDGVGIRLPAGARITIDTVYRGIGERVVERPQVALYFTPEPPANAATTAVMRAQAPARRNGTVARRLSAVLPLPEATTLIGLRPELGPDGQSIEIRARRPDGSVTVLLWVRSYRNEWPSPYVFRKPVALPAGSRLEATAYYDDGASDGPPQLTVTVSKYDRPAQPPSRSPRSRAPHHQH